MARSNHDQGLATRRPVHLDQASIEQRTVRNQARARTAKRNSHLSRCTEHMQGETGLQLIHAQLARAGVAGEHPPIARAAEQPLRNPFGRGTLSAKQFSIQRLGHEIALAGRLSVFVDGNEDLIDFGRTLRTADILRRTRRAGPGAACSQQQENQIAGG